MSLLAICRKCGNKGVDMHGQPCPCPMGRALVSLLADVKGAVDRAWENPSGQRFREEIGKAIDETPPAALRERLERGIERLKQRREGKE